MINYLQLSCWLLIFNIVVVINYVEHVVVIMFNLRGAQFHMTIFRWPIPTDSVVVIIYFILNCKFMMNYYLTHKHYVVVKYINRITTPKLCALYCYLCLCLLNNQTQLCFLWNLLKLTFWLKTFVHSSGGPTTTLWQSPLK